MAYPRTEFWRTTPQNWVGSNAAGLTLEPILTCNPGSGLKSGQYFNPSCFAVPPQGSQGDIIWPFIKGPAFFDTDMAIYKTFHITEQQSVQFRFDAFNFYQLSESGIWRQWQQRHSS